MYQQNTCLHVTCYFFIFVSWGRFFLNDKGLLSNLGVIFTKCSIIFGNQG